MNQKLDLLNNAISWLIIESIDDVIAKSIVLIDESLYDKFFDSLTIGLWYDLTGVVQNMIGSFDNIMIIDFFHDFDSSAFFFDRLTRTNLMINHEFDRWMSRCECLMRH